MKGFLLFTSWIFCYTFSYAQQRIIPENEYNQLPFSYEEVLKLVKEKGYIAEESQTNIYAYYDSTDCQYYWNYSSIDLYATYLQINACTGDINTETWRYEYHPHRHFDSDCKVYHDPDLRIMKRRLLANFESVDWKEYNNNKKGENHSEQMVTKEIMGVWEKRDTAFRYYEFILNKEPVNFLLYKEFYANGNIKKKGIRSHTQNCPLQIGIWYYFNPEGELTDIIDEDDLFSQKKEDIVNRSKTFGYSENMEDKYRIQTSGLPDIQINKFSDYSNRTAKWHVVFYNFNPYLAKTEFELDEMMFEPMITYYRKNRVNLKTELQRLKEEKELRYNKNNQ